MPDLLANMGRGLPVEGFEGWPGMPAGTGAVGRHLYVWLFLATVPHVRRYHTARSIPDDTSWATLADLGATMTAQRSVFGTGGLHAQWSLPLVFRGAYYRLGRLRFDRGIFPSDEASVPDGVLSPRRGDATINVHIPEGGPLDPAACDESFALARDFFPRHFPEEAVTCFACHSWLLDDQLADYLPEGSNMVRFQRRFHLLPSTPNRPPGDRAILEFVFHRMHGEPEITADLLDELPRDTTLQRAYVSHLRSGGHWHTRTGWFPF